MGCIIWSKSLNGNYVIGLDIKPILSYPLSPHPPVRTMSQLFFGRLPTDVANVVETLHPPFLLATLGILVTD